MGQNLGAQKHIKEVGACPAQNSAQEVNVL